jgi:CheY-like chemotaxis protein
LITVIYNIMFKKKPYRSCLIIDDNFIDNIISTKIIERANFAENFVVSKSPIEALQMLRERFIRPDIVFVDIRMKGMNGFEFIQEYKKIGIDNKKTKIYMLSSSIDPTDVQRARDNQDITGFITKNLTEKTLSEISDLNR